MTAADRRLALLLRFYVGLFAVAGLAYLLLPGETFAIANWVSRQLTPSLPPIPPSAEKFWLALSFALLATLAALSFVVQRDVARYRGCVVVIIASKLASTLVYLALFLLSARHLAYLMACATDGILFAVTLALYRRAEAV